MPRLRFVLERKTTRAQPPVQRPQPGLCGRSRIAAVLNSIPLPAAIHLFDEEESGRSQMKRNGLWMNKSPISVLSGAVYEEAALSKSECEPMSMSAARFTIDRLYASTIPTARIRMVGKRGDKR